MILNSQNTWYRPLFTWIGYKMLERMIESQIMVDFIEIENEYTVSGLRLLMLAFWFLICPIQETKLAHHTCIFLYFSIPCSITQQLRISFWAYLRKPFILFTLTRLCSRAAVLEKRSCNSEGFFVKHCSENISEGLNLSKKNSF